jgi:hypothetical protein
MKENNKNQYIQAPHLFLTALGAYAPTTGKIF